MKSPVYGIIKDVLIVAVFFLAFYAATHNSHVRPHPTTTRGGWSIELHQKPLAFGLAGHNFLLLRDSNNTVITTLHGLPTDKTTGAWKYVGRNKEDILQVFELREDDMRSKEKSYGIALISGEEDDIKRRWSNAKECSYAINKKELPYPPFGFSLREDTKNSNSVAYTLVSCMGLHGKHIGLFTPGWGRNLLEESKY
ncbi:MAG: hypothetical protein RI935_715 [Candidatus Parcubacteria bacterium]|jgi:GH15 family glucan-1,4-alpha-glucosidase